MTNTSHLTFMFDADLITLARRVVRRTGHDAATGARIDRFFKLLGMNGRRYIVIPSGAIIEANP